MPPASRPPTRRALFAKGLAGGALLLVAGAVPIAMRGTRPGGKPRSRLALLDETEHAILAAIAARVVPGDGAPAGWPSAADVDCAGRVDALLARVHPDAGRDFKRLLRLLENGMTGLAVDGRPTPFSQLGPAEQDARIAAWGRSRVSVLRSGYQAVVRLVNASFHSAPETYALVGYPGPPEVPQ